MNDTRPGLNLRRLVRLLDEAVARCGLDLAGAAVLTEAASGAYVVTPVLAALAGATSVVAMTRTTRYGSVEEITRHTLELAALAGVAPGRIRVISDKTAEEVALADVITNSGHVRPIDADMVNGMKPTAVIPLMYEAWEFRPTDVDLEACRRRGICVAGTNERHRAIDVFSYLGVMAVQLLHDAGLAVYRNKVLVLCDNPFGPFLERGLVSAGAEVTMRDCLRHVHTTTDYDALLVACLPGARPMLTEHEAVQIAARWPGAVVAQFWGDVDRTALTKAGVCCWPSPAPGSGHMGILPSAVGPEPIVRLQAGGLKVGEILWRSRREGKTPAACIEAAERSGFGMRVD